MVIESALLILAGYLLGSIPTAYLVGKWLKGLDLRRYGSGTVSGSMVYEHVARWAVVPVGLFDMGKAALPAWLGLQMGLGPGVAATAGLAAVAGHNWPAFFHFTGGRGLGTFMGLLLVIFPWGFPWMLGFLAVGWLLGDSAPWALTSLVTLPLFAHFVSGPDVMLPATGVMLLLTLVKRLEANRRPLPPPGPERRRVILRRLLLDRDIASHAEWIDRRPEPDSSDKA
ncbi:MAG: glycerol-3-phosphate acyltransferase [Anaerolineae bacterium]|jgi:glycerol-3-phosphate acyltransferase PlsY